MIVKVVLAVLILFSARSLTSDLKKPTILVSILVRNKEHTLPFFLSNFENLLYPKERVSLWIRSDHNVDQSIPILNTWIDSVKNSYHSIYTEFEDDAKYFSTEEGIAHWTDERFTHLINMRERGLNYARKRWADYFLSVDADVFLTNPDTLTYLISKNVTVVAPMLRSQGLYSNFWHGMTEDYYYLRTEDYQPILHRKNISCFAVPMIHSCVLVDLRRQESDLLTYRPTNDGPHDDIIAFALSAKYSDITLNLCNEGEFGYITVPLEQHDDIMQDYEQLKNIKMDILNGGEPLFVSDVLRQYVSMSAKDRMGFDRIFMINLARRPDRRERMQHCFDELGLEVEIFDAVDGKLLNESFLKSILYMPDFADPYHKRPMKLGEIGCFLSHYQLWKEIIENGFESTLILEDDIRFEPFFRFKVEHLMNEVMQIPDWDLVYFGRKRLQEKDEPWIPGSNYLVEPSYSYWTLGYVLSIRGANKLINANPLTKLVPVDEYIPILFDKHPQEQWKRHFPKRDLVALSASPLLLYPTHYTGEVGYVSDTEDSVVIPETVTERPNKDDL